MDSVMDLEIQLLVSGLSPASSESQLSMAMGFDNSRSLIWYKWITALAKCAGTGYFQPSLMLISFIVIVCTTRYSVQSSKSEDSVRVLARHCPASIAIEILGQVALGGAVFSSLMQCRIEPDSRHFTDTVLLSYTFVLGVIRLANTRKIKLHTILLHHINVIIVAYLIVELISTYGPKLFAQVSYHINHPYLLGTKLGCILVSVFIAFGRPRQWIAPSIAFDLAHRDPNDGPSPEEVCSWFSYFISYGWLSHIIWKGRKSKLGLEDLLPLPYYDEPLIWLTRILEARKRHTRTLATIASVLSRDIIKMIFFAAMTGIVEFVALFAMFQLLSSLSAQESATINPLFWVVLLFLGPLSRSIAYQQYIFASTRLIIHTKLSMVQELYRKALRSSNFDSSDARDVSGSQRASETQDRTVQPLEEILKTNAIEGPKRKQSVLNLFSYDVDAIWQSRDLILVSTAAPIEITLAIIFLYQMLGWCSLVGLAILLSSLPLAAFLSRKMSIAQKAVMRATDIRISLISETLTSIRIVKYFSWEAVMEQRIARARSDEQRCVWKRTLWATAIVVSGDFIPLFTLFIMFTTFTLVKRQPLTAAVAFTSLSVVEVLRQQFVWISNVTRFMSNATIAFQRVDTYFENATDFHRHSVGPPAFHNATFRRTPTSEFYLRNLNVQFMEGKLNVITGPSGSGKSSLLLSLLGETVLEAGSATCRPDTAYASQSAWLLNDTIRANILFYTDFEEARYNRVVAACGLQRDLAAFPDYDFNQVGENGSSLSGGQRQRIALARAMYSRASLLLLDDIFSALDVETAAHVWRECFRGELIKGRTVIIVTQQVWLSDEADLAINMAQGEITHLTHRKEDFRKISSDSLGDTKKKDLPPKTAKKHKIILAKPGESSANSRESDVSISQETSKKPRNPRSLFFQYMLQFGGRPYAIFVLCAAFTAQVTFFLITLWLSVWVGRYQKDEAVSVGFYLGIYGIVLMSFTFISGFSNLSFQLGAWKAARSMHGRLLSSVLSVSLSWYDKTPIGTVLNRFSRDIFSLDSLLVEYLRNTIDNGLRLLLRISSIGSIMPIFALPAAFVCVVVFIVGELYTKSQLTIKALASATQSPIFTHFTDSMAGLSVIRAYNMQEKFASVLARKMRIQARAEMTQYNLNRWVSIRADVAAATVAFMAGLIALHNSGTVSAGLVGFSLTNAIGLSTTILNMVRGMNELEVELNCFQRIREFAALDPEEATIEPEFDYPNSQDEATRPFIPVTDQEHVPVVEFRNVTARYTADGPDVLKNVSFTIKQGERVAVIGRTGSGKSTLALCILRFVCVVSGSILIDGIDIATMRLRDVRRQVSLIPQEPFLFSGSVRDNLDPSYLLSNEEVSNALKACSNLSVMSSHPKSSIPDVREIDSHTTTDSSTNEVGGITMSTRIAMKGENLSQGQRQILGIARAVARNSKIVLLDEATASVDYESDAAVQKILRKQFNTSSVLTIAHRLATIVDYDKIIVLSGGVVEEMGAPSTLWARKGRFFDMVQQSNEVEDLELAMAS